MSGIPKPRYGLILTVAIIAGLLAACAPIPSAEPAPSAGEPAEQPAESQPEERGVAVTNPSPLDGTSWSVTTAPEGEGATAAAGTAPTLNFQDGIVSGNAGCNSYSGEYEATDGNLKITLGAMTAMACETPEGIMDQERAFLETLQLVSAYRIEGARLVLLDAQGATIALFDAAGERQPAAGVEGEEPPTTVITADLTGAVWQWVETASSSGATVAIAEPERYTVTFLEDGTMAIQADCNSASATYTVTGDGLQVALGPVTLAACQPDSQSEEFLQELAVAESYLLSEGTLIISLAADGGDMKLVAAPAAPEVAIAAEAAEAATAAAPLPQVTGNTQGLTEDVMVTEAPATAYTAEGEAGPAGAPAHISVAFGGQEIIRVYPAQAYAELWQAAGDDTVSQTIDTLRALLTDRPAGAPAPLPVLPPSSAVNDLVAKYQYLEFTGGSGIAFVGRVAAARDAVLNGQLRYFFQGLTSDGAYYISIEAPVATPALPETSEGLTAEDRQLIESDFEGYLLEVGATLDGLSSSSFSPDLDQIDAMVESINIVVPETAVAGADSAPVEPEVVEPEPVEPAAPAEPAGTPEPAAPEAQFALGTAVWQWVAATAADGTVTMVPQPELFTLQFMEDGIVSIVADCNRGAGAYQEEGGRLAIRIGALTRAACPPDSLDKQFLQSLAATEGYTIENDTLMLTLKNGAGVLKFKAVAIE